MPECNYCHKEISMWSINDYGTCPKPECYEPYLEQKAIADVARNKDIVENFMRPYLDGEKVQLFLFGYTDPVNHQTVAKDMGQALASGALGMAAPFLVKSADFKAKIVLLVFGETKIFSFTFEEIPLGGNDAYDLFLDMEHFEYFLTQHDVKKSFKRALIKDVEKGTGGLMLKGKLSFSATPASAERIPGNATRQDVIYKIQGMSDMVTPAALIQAIIEDRDLPDENEQKRMGGNKAYVQELIDILERTNNDANTRSQKVMDALKAMHPSISERVRIFIKEQSKDAVDGTPSFSKKAIIGGGLVLLCTIWRMSWIMMNEDKFEQGSFAASGLGEIIVGFIAVVAISIGFSEKAENKKRLWYRDNL